MNRNIENEAALILSVCYGIRTDVAIELVVSKKRKISKEEIVKKELRRFFNKNYEVKINIFEDYALNEMSTKELSEKYNVSSNMIREYLRDCDVYFSEFKGMIELGMLDYYDNLNLMSFLAKYGRYHKAKEKMNIENYNLYQKYLEGNITYAKLRFYTHMTPKTLSEI
ncbi:hypothetical protein [Eubacterium sp.]|uniref:hypothetical protein n=1 Tax=Eubacterium sp. TaxID=142586 RepID=UPI00352220F5